MDQAADHATRLELLRRIARQGPVSAVPLAEALHLAPAGIRRHLAALHAQGLITEHAVPQANPGRGRPAKHFVATAKAHGELNAGEAALAADVLAYLALNQGRQAVAAYAQDRAARMERRYTPAVAGAGASVRARAEALAKALNDDGFAATARPCPGQSAVQLCQGHCPIHAVAADFPELCEAETAAIARLLGVHVQRLATLAGGDHVCTTRVPATTTRERL